MCLWSLLHLLLLLQVSSHPLLLLHVSMSLWSLYRHGPAMCPHSPHLGWHMLLAGGLAACTHLLWSLLWAALLRLLHTHLLYLV